MPAGRMKRLTRGKLTRKRSSVPRGYKLVPKSQVPGHKGHPFGKKFYTKLRYNEAHFFPAGTSNNFASSYKMRLNSCYDPNLTGLGHQPRGFDELTSIYEKYTVVGAKITVCYVSNSTTPAVVGLRTVDGNESSIVDKKVAIENGDSSWKYMANFNGGSNKQVISRTVNCKKFFNQKNIVGTDKFTLDANENPALDDAIIGEIWVAPISATQVHGQTMVDITIEYQVVFTEPKTLPTS